MKPLALMLPLLAVLLAGAAALAQEPYSMQTAALPSDLPKALADTLVKDGVRLMVIENGLSVPVCEVWFSRTVRSRARPGGKSEYASLSTGSLIGVLHFPSEGEDSENQELKGGYYTMRYARLPYDEQTGFPRDTLILIPLWADKQPATSLTRAALLKLSRLASRTTRPAAMNLVAVNAAYKDSPAIITDDQGTCVLQITIQLRKGSAKPADFPLAILLVSPVRENDES